ncbi:MAG: DUF6036 family nucleotidyltransferase [Bacteroidota bacterium]
MNDHEVKYLVVGGYAVNAHGYPRYTKDIDFWLWMSEENIQKLISVIQDFGLGSLGLKIEDFMNPDGVVQLGFPPNRIDILVHIEGVKFQDCFARKSVIELENVPINFLSIEDLIIAKKAAGRLQDMADVEQLEQLLKHESK